MTQKEKEKIIDEIIDNSFSSDIFNDRTDVEIIKLDTVLDIIKRNLKDEKYNGLCQDVEPKKCKWILYDHTALVSKDHENIYWRIPTRYKVELKYCPYCSKEIDYSEVDTEIEERKNKNA